MNASAFFLFLKRINLQPIIVLCFFLLSFTEDRAEDQAEDDQDDDDEGEKKLKFYRNGQIAGIIVFRRAINDIDS